MLILASVQRLCLFFRFCWASFVLPPAGQHDRKNLPEFEKCMFMLPPTRMIRQSHTEAGLLH